MSDLIIRGTSKTPEINLKQNGLIELKGVSSIENTKEFFNPDFRKSLFPTKPTPHP